MAEKDGVNDDEALSKSLRRWRKTGDLDDLRMRVWRAVRAAEQVMYDPKSTRAEVLKAVYAVSNVSGQYLKVLEADEVLERIERLEAWKRSTNSNNP